MGCYRTDCLLSPITAFAGIPEFVVGIGRRVPCYTEAVDVEYHVPRLHIILGVVIVSVWQQFGQVMLMNLFSKGIFWGD